MNKLSEDEKDEIIEHMNSEHPDAVLLYLKHYANLPLSESGVIVDVEENEIKVKATIQGRDSPELKSVMVVIPLIRRVETIKEAEHVMVEMFLAAKKALAV
ncbi:MAG: DUF2470 domain-containing protein [Pseudomonadota bacterium]|nr:DUF2470 domain-containing protein [Pseudomonadota bacterium]